MEWGIVYYQDARGRVPGLDFLDACPTKVAATFLAVLEAVRAAPPPAFSGGGKWEAMHGTMAGYYEIRVTGPGRRHYRLFCILDNGTAGELAERGFDGPQIAVINGMVKANASLLSDREYGKQVRGLGGDYLAQLRGRSTSDRSCGYRGHACRGPSTAPSTLVFVSDGSQREESR